MNTSPLCKLTSDNTKREKVGVVITEETSWVSLNLSNLETSGSILSIRTVQSSSEWTSKTSLRVSHLVISNWVVECQTRWARGTTGGFMDVCCGLCWRQWCAGDVVESDLLDSISGRKMGWIEGDEHSRSYPPCC